MEFAFGRARLATFCLVLAALPAFPACTYRGVDLCCESAALVNGERVAVLHRRHQAFAMPHSHSKLLSENFAIVRHRLDGPDETQVTWWASKPFVLPEREGPRYIAVVGGTGTVIDSYLEWETRSSKLRFVGHFVQHFDPATQRYTGPPIDVTHMRPEGQNATLTNLMCTRSRRYWLMQEGLFDVVEGREVDDANVRGMIRQVQQAHAPNSRGLLITDDLAWAAVTHSSGTYGEFMVRGQQYSRSDVGIAFSSRGLAPQVVPNESDDLRLLTVESIDGVLHCIYGESEPDVCNRARLQIVDAEAGVVRADRTLDGVFSPYSYLLWDYRRQTVILRGPLGTHDIVVWDYGRDEVRRLIIDPRDVDEQQP